MATEYCVVFFTPIISCGNGSTVSTVLTFSVVHQQPLLGENAPYALLLFSCALSGYIVTELLLPLNHNCSLFSGRLFLNTELKQWRWWCKQEQYKRNRFRLAKQQLFYTLFAITAHYNMKMPNFMFCGGCQQRVATFFFFFCFDTVS